MNGANETKIYTFTNPNLLLVLITYHFFHIVADHYLFDSDALSANMGVFLFTCPTTSLKMHGWVADDSPAAEYYEAVECPACKRVHLVNPRTGKVAGDSSRS